MKRRVATADELRLWAMVVTTVAPLGDRLPLEAPAEPQQNLPRTQPSTRLAEATAPAASRALRTGAGPALAAIDRRLLSRVSRGVVTLDGRLDLHGMTQQAAHGQLIRFLKEAQGDGARMVLVITGKGRPASEDGEERGVLRRAVPTWLAAAEMRPYVVGFGEAAPPHGGTGALYVRIRRARG